MSSTPRAESASPKAITAIRGTDSANSAAETGRTVTESASRPHRTALA